MDDQINRQIGWSLYTPPKTSLWKVFYTNIDMNQRYKTRGRISYYEIGVSCVFNGHVIYTMLL